jgi:salicylate hydroxylase
VRAVIIGGGMGGLAAALSLRHAGVFDSIEAYEQTKTPSTAGAGLNIAPNGARLVQRWLGVDLDGGDPKRPRSSAISTARSPSGTWRTSAFGEVAKCDAATTRCRRRQRRSGRS